MVMVTKEIFENSLLYPCSGFDGFILRAVNNSVGDSGNKIPFDVNSYIYVDHKNYIHTKEGIPCYSEELIKFYAEFRKTVLSNPFYDFQFIDFNALTENVFNDKFISIDEIIELKKEKRPKFMGKFLSELGLAENSKEFANSDFSNQDKIEIDEENEWVLGECSEDWGFSSGLEEKIRQRTTNKIIVFSAKGTLRANIQGQIEHDMRSKQDEVYITYIVCEIKYFWKNVFDFYGIEKMKVLVVKFTSGNNMFFDVKLNTGKLMPEFIICDDYFFGDFQNSNYQNIDSMHQGWQINLNILKRTNYERKLLKTKYN